MKNVNGNRLSRNNLIDGHNQFLQEQLMETQQSLFFARSVKEVKFLQNRIDYLKLQIRGVNSKGIKR